MQIPFLNLASDQKKAEISGILSEIQRVAESADFIQGSKVAEFESRFAAHEDGRSGIGCNSGLDALILALRSLGVGPGDEVITSPFSFIATAAAISLVGARPVFADICQDGTLDPSCAEAAITPRTKAVLPVLWAGIPGRLREFRRLCESRGLFLVLDAAQAVGTRYRGAGIGNLGDAVCYSLHPLKNLGVWGDGGMVLTSRPELAARIRLGRNHGLINRDEAAFFSYNSRLDTIQAVVALAHLNLVDDILERRSELAARYLVGLAGQRPGLKIPLAEPSEGRAGIHLFQIITGHRTELREFLAKRGVETKVHYPVLMPFQPASSHLGYRKGDFPVAERFADGVVSLPIREDLSFDEIDYIVASIGEFNQGAVRRVQVPAELSS